MPEEDLSGGRGGYRYLPICDKQLRWSHRYVDTGDAAGTY